MKIAIVVHGRFHAFDLARELLKRGHDVTLFTNYPKRVAEQFGIPRQHVRTLLFHGALSRVSWWIHKTLGFPYPEAFLHRMFGAWISREIRHEIWDVVHAWSGISEEVRISNKGEIGLKLLMRGSAHIRIQAQILREEEERVGKKIDCPSPWMIAREEREYELTDKIIVLSRFALKSFIRQGVPSEKLRLLPLGVNTQIFRPSISVIEERCRRIVSGEPLRVLYVGAVSFRKGMWDLKQIIGRLSGGRFKFRLVGEIEQNFSSFAKELASEQTKFLGKQSQHKLPKQYEWSDLFIFPTLEDGFAAVLMQASAASLPILVTENCGAPDFVRPDETGWILPIRSPEAFVERLLWCDSHREELAQMVLKIYHKFRPRDWSDVARDFERICEEGMKKSGN